MSASPDSPAGNKRLPPPTAATPPRSSLTSRAKSPMRGGTTTGSTPCASRWLSNCSKTRGWRRTAGHRPPRHRREQRPGRLLGRPPHPRRVRRRKRPGQAACGAPEYLRSNGSAAAAFAGDAFRRDFRVNGKPVTPKCWPAVKPKLSKTGLPGPSGPQGKNNPPPGTAGKPPQSLLAGRKAIRCDSPARPVAMHVARFPTAGVPMTMLTPLPASAKETGRAPRNLSAGPAGRPPRDPCRRPEHRHAGYAYPAFRTGDCGSPGWPQSLFASRRVLFFACIGCADEEFARLFPGCPPQHGRTDIASTSSAAPETGLDSRSPGAKPAGRKR